MASKTTQKYKLFIYKVHFFSAICPLLLFNATTAHSQQAIPSKDPTDNLVSGEQHVLINANSDGDASGADDTGGNVYIGRNGQAYIYIDSSNDVNIWNLEAENNAIFKENIDVDGATTLDDTTIDGTFSAAGTANINVTGASNTTIGNIADGQTSINSKTINIGTSNTGSSITVGSSAAGSISINSKSIDIGTDVAGSTTTLTAKGGDFLLTDAGAALSGASSEGSLAAVRISGTNLSNNTSQVGVEIYGDGNGAGASSDAGTANWADVLIRSKSYDPANGGSQNGLGSAIVVNDYGIQLVSPRLTQPDQVSNNTFGSGENNVAGTVVNNSIGQGGMGTVNNSIGSSDSSGNTSNKIGVNSGSGNIVNQLGDNTGSGSVVNSFGSNSGSGSSVNNFGTGSGATANNIGNNNRDTTIALSAGGASSNLANGINTQQVTADPTATPSSGVGASVLTNPTQTTAASSGVVLKNAPAAQHASVDPNGKIIEQNGEVKETTASVIVTNGYGNTHGLIVNETQATISGGINSSSLTLNDFGATFSNSDTGLPIQVHGVADGTAPYDAVNVRQLEAGLASAAALSGLPDIRPGSNNSFGIAFGAHGDGRALAIGGQHYVGDSVGVKYGFSTNIDGANINHTAYAGMGWSW